MNEMIPFEMNGKQLRTAGTWSAPLFDAGDLCELFDFKNPYQAIASHVDKEDLQKLEVLSNGGKQKRNYVTESGMWKLALRSNSPRAKPVQRWITSEVLPAIRKTGYYNFAQQKIELLLSPHIQPWVKLFPPEFWINLDRLYGIKRIDPNKHPMFYAQCVEFVYSTFDPDVHEEMRNRVPEPGKSGTRQHQTLNEAGRMAMERHIARHIGLQDASGDSDQWKDLARRVFSKQGQFPFRDKRRLPAGDSKESAS